MIGMLFLFDALVLSRLSFVTGTVSFATLHDVCTSWKLNLCVG